MIIKEVPQYITSMIVENNFEVTLKYWRHNIEHIIEITNNYYRNIGEIFEVHKQQRKKKQWLLNKAY